MVHVKKWPTKLQIDSFFGVKNFLQPFLFGGLFLGRPRPRYTKSLLMGASVHRLALLNAFATPWHKALVSGPSGTGATSTTSATSAWDTPRVWWVVFRVGGRDRCFFFTKKKRWEKTAKNCGKKNGRSTFQGFFGVKGNMLSFVKNNAWIIHTSCNEDYCKIHVGNNFEVEYQLFIDLFTSH